MQPDSLLVQANRYNVMRSVAAGFVHNLRNPVQAIMMSAEALGDDSPPDVIEQFGSIIRTEADRAHAYLNTMSELFAEDRVEPGPVALHGVMDNACEMGYAMRPRTGVKPHLSMGPDLPAIAGTERDVVQVILNLISNAKWASQGVPDPRIELVAAEESGEVVIAVTDNGRGVSAALGGDPFDLYSTDREGAAGIGLAATREIAAILGGSVDLNRDKKASLTCATLRLRRWRDV